MYTMYLDPIYALLCPPINSPQHIPIPSLPFSCPLFFFLKKKKKEQQQSHLVQLAFHAGILTDLGGLVLGR